MPHSASHVVRDALVATHPTGTPTTCSWRSELYTPEYAGVIKERWIVQKLLTQGAIQLATVLNWIFAEVGGDKLKSTYLTL